MQRYSLPVVICLGAVEGEKSLCTPPKPITTYDTSQLATQCAFLPVAAQLLDMVAAPTVS